MCSSLAANTSQAPKEAAPDPPEPGPNAEYLNYIWRGLASPANTIYYATEQSNLRWMLRAMGEASPAAETLRRYPLTWQILDFVFRRIPLFALAKALTDCNFVAVLKQTLVDISKPVVEATGQRAPAKRKRTLMVAFDLQCLQTADGCLETAQTVFGTLKSFLRHLDKAENAASREKIGAEYIKALFCTSAAEASTIVAPALKICGNALVHQLHNDGIQGAHDWIQTISEIWNFHLQASEDAVEVATWLFIPSTTILRQVGCLSHTEDDGDHKSFKKRWSIDIQSFMHRNLIIPAREEFFSHKSLLPVERALQVSQAMLEQAASALYLLCCSVPGSLADSKMRKSQVEWLKQIFKVIELAARQDKKRGDIIKFVLDEAIRWNAPIDVDDLGRICREYALQGQATDWDLVSKISRCDADVYLLTQDGINLQRQICSRSIREDRQRDKDGAISEVIAAFMDGCKTRRNLPSFLRLWFEQLCEVEGQDAAARSPWYQVGQPTTPTESLGSLIETELFPAQVTNIISWLEAKELKEYAESICIFTSVIADALRREEFVDAVEQRLYRLVAGVKSAAGPRALKWRVVSRTMSWVSAKERVPIWSSVKKKLAKILTKSSPASSEALEAFKCCVQAWDLMSPDDAHTDEAASLTEDFMERLTSEMNAEDTASGVDVDTLLEPEDKAAFHCYFSWCMHSTKRFNRLLLKRKRDTPQLWEVTTGAYTTDTTRLQSVWKGLLHNDINLNTPKLSEKLVERLIAGLEGSRKEKGWPAAQGQTWIKLLASLPHETISRAQRKQIMNILGTYRAKMLRHPQRVSLDGWMLLLSLMTKLMSRTTFYQDMKFLDLVELGEALSKIELESSADGKILLEIIEIYYQLASVTLRQMTMNIECSNDFFSDVLEFAGKGSKSERSALIMTLLKAVHMVSKRSMGDDARSLLHKVETAASKRCSKLAMRTLQDLMSKETLLESDSVTENLSLLAALDAASCAARGPRLELSQQQRSNLVQRSQELMNRGDLRGWKIQALLRKLGGFGVEDIELSKYGKLERLPPKRQEALLKELVEAVTDSLPYREKAMYLKTLIQAFRDGCNTDGQILAIQFTINQLLCKFPVLCHGHYGEADGWRLDSDASNSIETEQEYSLAVAHSDLVGLLLRKPLTNTTRLGNVLHTLLNKQPRAMNQWNVEATLSTVCKACYEKDDDGGQVPFTLLCRLVNVIICKHRLRLQGHHHLLVCTLDALLTRLVVGAPQWPGNDSDAARQEQWQEASAQQFARLITLVCEPPVGLVARTQVHRALDSVRDTARRAAGQFMDLVLMRYVKLQLDEVVSWRVREALEPAVVAMFNLLAPEQRKRMSDSMDSNGRAILKEMYKRYVKFGKWSGV